jgi:alpha-tubulin suppressor-like RCC1 family protein
VVVACFLMALACWGFGLFGMLGNGQLDHSLSPVDPGLSDVVQLAGGYYHACALHRDSTLSCWGNNDHGQLGVEGIDMAKVPTKVPNLDQVTQVAASANHTCAVRADHSVWCWGDGKYGQLGHGDTASHPTPTQVPGVSDAVEVDTGTDLTCARLGSGQVSCWGMNFSGQLGRPELVGEPLTAAVVAGVSNCVQVVAGHSMACALLIGGDLKCWGQNWYGQLGDGTTDDAAEPKTVLRPW